MRRGEKEGRGDTETRRHGDTGTRGHGDAGTRGGVGVKSEK